jgi:hypothetical protein
MYKGNFTHIHTRIFTSVVYPCIYDEEKKTKVSNGNPLQLTVFVNVLENISFTPDNESYLVLPFPLITGKNRVKIFDIDNYPKIFEDLSLTFETDEKENDYDVIGKYEVSILNKIDDLDLSYKIKNNYKTGFGFLKCIPKFHKLKNKEPAKTNKTEFLPFAYVHEIKPDTKMFIPSKLIFINKLQTFASAATEIELDDTVNDKFINWFLKKKEKPAPPPVKADNKSFEIYITNFPRVAKNPLLTQAGVLIKEKKIKEKHDLFLSKSKFPKNLEIKKIDFIHQINIDNEYKFNHNLYC